MKLDVNAIVSACELRPGTEDGFRALLDMIAADGDIQDVRWAAYMLATVKHECANTWEPIEEFGRGRGHEYGRPHTVEIGNESFTNCYYGRGYVQLTWLDNYRNMSHFLGMGEELLKNPELALNRATAYKIMSYGMRHGSFTGKRLANYLHDDVSDYVNARRIINGLDKADLIADYAYEFERVLKSAVL